MDKEKVLELLEDFIDFLKEKDDEKVVDVIEDKDEMDDVDDDFDKEIVKISKGE